MQRAAGERLAARRQPSVARGGGGVLVLCHGLYGLFALNAWTRGDKVFVLGTVERTADGALVTRGHAGVPAC
jgi:hypothetical protein